MCFTSGIERPTDKFPPVRSAPAFAVAACEFDRLYNHEQVRWARERDETPSPAGARRLPRPIAVTSRMMADVLQAIAGLVLIPAADCPDQPAWVQGFPYTSVPAAASLGAGACQASGAGTNGLQDSLAQLPHW